MTRINFAVDGIESESVAPAVAQIGPLFTSGLISPGEAPDAADGQARSLFKMIGVYLTAAGIDWDDIAKLDFYLADLGHAAAIDGEWRRRFPHTSMRPVRDDHHRPALPGGALVAATFLAYRDT